MSRRTVYLCKDEENDVFVYVSLSAHDCKLFVGDGQTMRYVPTTRVTRYRDGGTDGSTTIVETAERRWFFPSPYRSEYDSPLVPRWGDQELVSLHA